jgi:DNA-binding NtrC family response regulator
MSEKPFTIYVLEDNEWYNKLLLHHLSLNPDFVVKGFFTGGELLNSLQDNPDVITLDYRLPDYTGEEMLRKIKEYNPAIEVIVISEQSEIETAVGLLKMGAYDYFVKSEDIRERLLNALNHIRNNKGLNRQIISLKQEVQDKYTFGKTIIGASESIKKIHSLLEKATQSNIVVSISGETGTGKEVVAKAIHYNSERKNKPFIAVNMAAVPSELIESELFGYEKGAFTGAVSRRKGKFEEADGGTLFLDEIGETNPAFQAKLLRVLQEKEITRIGNNIPMKVDCRIIVATNRNLADEVKKGNFREDLYYRLLGISVHLPPLRERGKDVLVLSQHFIQLFSKENGMSPKTLTDEAKKKITTYQWPGNIRELKSVMDISMIMSNGNYIDACDISLNGNDVLPDLLSGEMTMREYNRRIVNIYMQKYNNNTKLVANKLGIGQTTVYRLLKEDEDSDNSEIS